MGGQALKDLGVGRVSAAEYARRMQVFADIVNKIEHETAGVVEVAYHFPMPIFGKEDYGDLDVIYCVNPHYNEVFLDSLKSHFNSKGSKKNGSVTSIEWEGFQVDMIYANIEEYDWTLNWYSHGDASAIRGRVYRYYNFKFGHDGLYYNVRTKNFSKDILVTRDWKAAHNLMGYKPLSNFFMYKEEDIFQHTVSSPYCHPDVFDLLRPERPRKTQTAFYEWVKKYFETDHREPYKREYGKILLMKYNYLLFLKVGIVALNLQRKELSNPVRKKVRKFMWTKVYPVAFKLRGWL